MPANGQPHGRWDSTTATNGVERVLIAAGFHPHCGTLVAYFANYGSKPESPHLLTGTTTNGVDWFPPPRVG